MAAMLMETAIAAAALAVSLLMRPWRMVSPAIATPLLGTLAVLPWLWALPALQRLLVKALADKQDIAFSGGVTVMKIIGG